MLKLMFYESNSQYPVEYTQTNRNGQFTIFALCSSLSLLSTQIRLQPGRCDKGSTQHRQHKECNKQPREPSWENNYTDAPSWMDWNHSDDSAQWDVEEIRLGFRGGFQFRAPALTCLSMSCGALWSGLRPTHNLSTWYAEHSSAMQWFSNNYVTRSLEPNAKKGNWIVQMVNTHSKWPRWQTHVLPGKASPRFTALGLIPKSHTCHALVQQTRMLKRLYQPHGFQTTNGNKVEEYGLGQNA